MWVTGRAHLMHFKLITVFALMMHKVFYSVSRNESPPTQRILTSDCILSTRSSRQLWASLKLYTCTGAAEMAQNKLLHACKESPKKLTLQCNELEGRYTASWLKTDIDFISVSKVQQKANWRLAIFRPALVSSSSSSRNELQFCITVELAKHAHNYMQVLRWIAVTFAIECCVYMGKEGSNCKRRRSIWVIGIAFHFLLNHIQFRFQ